MHLGLVPAYGRDYKSRAAVMAAWNAGKDFVIATAGRDCGRYINKAQADAHGITVQIRYATLRRVTPLIKPASKES